MTGTIRVIFSMDDDFTQGEIDNLLSFFLNKNSQYH